MNPKWDPSGNRIVFTMGDARNYRYSEGPRAFKSNEKIMWISTNGGQLNYISESNGRSFPHFVNGKDRIYLFHNSKGLVSIKWDGTDEKNIIKVTGSTPYGSGDTKRPSNASLILISPDGNKGLAKKLIKLVKEQTKKDIVFQKPISPLGEKLLKSLEK